MSTSATPAMRQYLDAKQQHRDAILLFRMGDFYEMFYEDALLAARTLELTLTSRAKDTNGGAIPMCGVPFHAVDGYIARLIKKGFRVAVCDQVEDARKAKGIVKREVVRVISPGTFTDANYLDAREPAFLMSVTGAGQNGQPIGVALLDVSTGEFTATEYSGADGWQTLSDELAVCVPAKSSSPETAWRTASRPTRARSPRVGPCSRPPGCRSRPSTPGRSTAKRPGARCWTSCARPDSAASASRTPAAIAAAGALVHYLRATQKADVAHVRAVAPPARRCPADRSDDAQASGNRRRVGRRTLGIAARRARSHDHVDGQPDAPVVAAPPAAAP
jgi:DNA mismatch repair protein MutS